MYEATILKDIRRLFVGRSDVHAKQTASGDYISIREPLTDTIIEMHLAGSVAIGIYQLGDDDICIWGCYDADIGSKKAVKAMTSEEIQQRKAQELTNIQAVQNTLKNKYNVDSYIEDSGWKGYHLWIFCEPTPASILRRFMEQGRKDVVVNIHEIFPKQDKKGDFGNLVKLPFALHRVSNRRSCFLNPSDNRELTTEEGAALLATIQPCKIPVIEEHGSGKEEQRAGKEKEAGKLGSRPLTEVLPELRPCFQKAHNNKWEAEDDDGHRFRLYAFRELQAKGASREAIHEYFNPLSKYNYEETEKGINKNYKKLVKPALCKTIQRDCGDLNALLETCKTCPHNPANKQAAAREPTTAEILQELLVGAVFFHNNNDPYVRVVVDGHKEIWGVNSNHFRRFLAGGHFLKVGEAAAKEGLTNLITALEGMAIYHGVNHDLSNRVAWHNGAIWWDLSNENWMAIKITAEGWNVEEPPILFRRYQHQKPQVAPIKNGDITKLDAFVHLKSEGDKLLFRVYLVSLFIPRIPHTILVLYGDQGSAKSTLFKLVKSLVDPSKTDILTFSKNAQEMVQKLDHNWFCGFDNVSDLPDWLSDMICRASTGEGFSKRALYTDDDDKIYSYKRCVGVNGINIAGTNPDFLDRSILLELKRIPMNERKTEDKLWQTFAAAKPDILGGILETVSKAMKIKSGLSLSVLPRMADFAEWGYAIAEALGSKGQDFLDVYYANIEAQNREVISGNVIGEVVLKFMADRKEWMGTASALLAELETVADSLKISTKSKGWPGAGNVLSRKLNVLNVNLLEVGIIFDVIKDMRKNTLHLRRVSENISNISIPPSSTSGEAEKHGGIHGGIDGDISISNISPYIPPCQNRDAEGKYGGMEIMDVFSEPQGVGAVRNNTNAHARMYYSDKQESFGNMSSENTSILRQDIELAGHEWEQKKGASINSTNLTEFLMWYCEHKDQSKQPSDIKDHARKIFKLTPDTTKTKVLSRLCKDERHTECYGETCSCDCHVK